TAHAVAAAPPALAAALGRRVARVRAPGFAAVEFVGPAAVVSALVLGQAPLVDLVLALFRHPGVVGEEPHQPLLIGRVLVVDPFPRGVVAVGILVVHPDVVGGEAA